MSFEVAAYKEGSYSVDVNGLTGISEVTKPSRAQLRVIHGYWQREEPEYYEAIGSCVDPEAKLVNKETYEWARLLSEVVNALVAAGLTIQSLDEYPYSVDARQMSLVERGEKGPARLPGYELPLMYSIKAAKNRV